MIRSLRRERRQGGGLAAYRREQGDPAPSFVFTVLDDTGAEADYIAVAMAPIAHHRGAMAGLDHDKASCDGDVRRCVAPRVSERPDLMARAAHV